MYWANHIKDLVILALGGLSVSTVAFATLWVRARERAARAESFLEGVRTMSGRTESTNPALDAMAVEIERIGEGQRFLTRVMSEQSARPGAAPRGGIVTPH